MSKQLSQQKLISDNASPHMRLCPHIKLLFFFIIKCWQSTDVTCNCQLITENIAVAWRSKIFDSSTNMYKSNLLILLI